MMGAVVMRQATEFAMLNANYVSKKLESAYPILYKGTNGFVAHECLLDLRPLKEASGISEEDIAKRLMDFGFHAPTMSFPVAGTLMIEPTESESKIELDKFIEAMLIIRKEIDQVINGEIAAEASALHNAPHTQEMVTADVWDYPYSRQQAAFPLDYIKENKFWLDNFRESYVNGTSPQQVLSKEEKIKAVTAKDIQAVAKKYLSKDKVVAMLMPEE